MADDSFRASSPEPAEATPARRRHIQIKSSSSSASRGSMDCRFIETGHSPAYTSQSQQWRDSSSPRSRFPRPYTSRSGGGHGSYFKRQSMSYEGARATASYQRDRAFSRSRGRSVSRSPKSPPRSRSRSRSRSFSPRGHRTFVNWEQGGRSARTGQYVYGREGRGNQYDSRQCGRERDTWPRGGGRGGGRCPNYQRGNRFYPKEVRYKTAAITPRDRSISWERGSNDDSASVVRSFRDRQMRDRGQDRWDYESGYRERTRERELSSRSLSLIRTSSFASDYYREREPSVSAEEGEEKSEENYVATSERSLESQTPSESGSINWEMTNATESSTKRMVVSSTPALPPRSTADSSWTSGMFEDSDGHSGPINKTSDWKRKTVEEPEW
ncbi:unnamed protein product [Peronospora destructor]|uniref:Btz domain-containing protein n=1 Tax=Peronospora destructor TaxID=86335 RepID=A0AAV0V1W0_9STRA|nr:unnamed protein product [Peronospora destructor]